MTRVRTKLTMYSEFDAMTGLMNRRGMEHRLTGMLGKQPMMFACVLDMDGLKYINDNFGHAEGDSAIIELAHAARSITMPGEICIRAGGAAARPPGAAAADLPGRSQQVQRDQRKAL